MNGWIDRKTNSLMELLCSTLIAALQFLAHLSYILVNAFSCNIIQFYVHLISIDFIGIKTLCFAIFCSLLYDTDKVSIDKIACSMVASKPSMIV